MAQITSEAGISFIKGQEGFRSYVYYCSADEATIGYGTTNYDAAIIGLKVKKGLTCTKKQADKWLRAVLTAKYEKLVRKYDDVYHWTQAEFDALVSFAYNIGTIKQLTADGTRSRAQIADAMLLYVGAGGKTNSGLANRRKAERRMFLSGRKEIEYDMNTLRKGDRGQQVKALQKLIGGLTIDGVFGTDTETAVKAVQAQFGLTVDGIVGANTWGVLLA